MASIDWAVPAVFTELSSFDPASLGPGDDPVEICRPVRHLVIQPRDATAAGLGEDRQAENQIRPAGRLVQRLLELDPAPLTAPRDPARRVVGTCRHFAVLACALLRHHGIAARARCGFATYFQSGQALDHWVVEYLTGAGWVRVDAEVLGANVTPHAAHLRPEDFLSGGEAWQAYRRGEVDASTFGVYGTENFGPSEIRGNAVRDLACLVKIETLPWDEWGRMTDAYDGRTGEDYDELLDELASACAGHHPDQVIELYRHDDLRVPERLIV